MNEKLNEALNEISDTHIAEAAKAKRRRPYWIGAVAAVVAIAIAVGIFWDPRAGLPTVQGTEPAELPVPGPIQSPGTLQLANLVAGPAYPDMVSCPNYDDYDSYAEYSADYSVWRESQRAQYDQPDGYADSLTDFFIASICEFLNGQENQAYSPVNVYLALAMLAETTGGESRQQILELLGADSIEDLREQAGYVWNAHYSNDGQTTLLLGNSVWLDEEYPSHQETVERLADSYYASVFSGDLGTGEMNAQLQAWLNAQTGGLLEEQAGNMELDPRTVFALASTVYFSARWEDEFAAAKTENAVFHCADKELVTPFMNRSFSGTYFWGKHFGAVYLSMTGNNQMWLILPDEGYTVADILESGEYLEMTLDPWHWEDITSITINLSLPKFDIASETDLSEGIRNLGVTDIFDSQVSDFSAITDANGLFVDKMDHAARVAIDEEGCVAAAFTVIADCGSGMPPEEEVDFVLDRPFLFVVSSRDNLPLFVGTVAEP